MWLRFIGKDGSMGLTHGTVYHCTIKTMGGYIWVRWNDKDIKDPSFPYKSFKEFLSEWEEVGDEE